MRIYNHTPLNFGNLYCSKTVISKMSDKNFAKKVSKVYDTFVTNGFHKKTHADIELDFDKLKGLIGIISSKNKKTLFKPQYKFLVSSKPEDIVLFSQRLDELNSCYAIKGKKAYREYQKRALIALKNDILQKMNK